MSDTKTTEEVELIRLNVAVPKTLNDRLNKAIPHGLKSDIVRKLMEMFADYIDSDGRAVIILLHEDKIKFTRNTTGSN